MDPSTAFSFTPTAIVAHPRTPPTSSSSCSSQPITIPLDSHKLARLSTEKRQLIQGLATLVEKELTYIPGSSYDRPWPASKFTTNTTQDGGDSSPLLPSLVQLLPKATDLDEIPELAMVVDPKTGRKIPRRLSPQQMGQIANEATFQVQSRKYPNHKHVWKVATWLAKGRINVQKSFRRGIGRALYHIIIGVPNRLVKNTFMSLRRGSSYILKGICGVCNSFMGWKETVPKYSTTEIRHAIQMKENDYILTRLQQQQQQSNASPNEPDPSLPNMRVFDDEFRKSIEKHVEAAYQRANHLWNKADWTERMKIKKQLQDELQSGQPDPSNTSSSVNQHELDNLNRRLQRRRHAFISEILQADPVLNSQCPGYGRMLAERDLLDWIVLLIEQDFWDFFYKEKNIYRQDIIQRNPVFSLVEDWLEQRAENMTQESYQQKRWAYHQEQFPKLAAKEGLSQFMTNVYINHILKFRKEEQDDIRKQMFKETKASHTFTFFRRIWRPKNWSKEKVESRNNKGLPVITFRPIKYVTEQVATDKFFWRWAIIFHEIRCRICNGVYWLYQTLINSPIGVKSLLLKEPFVSRYVMDSSTGEILPDLEHKTHTLQSRIAALGVKARALRNRFESQPDTSLFGKPIARCFNILYAYVGILIPGTLYFSIGQPLITLGYLCLATALMVTAPIWAPVSSLFGYMYSVALFDLHPAYGFHTPVTRRWFPLLGHIGGDLLIFGLARIIVALFAGIIVHPLFAGFLFVWEMMRKLLRTLYDWIMRRILSLLGRVPGRDSFLAWRIAGPGITAKYSYRITPEVALLALRAKLEEEELEIFEQHAAKEINRPLDMYREFFADFADFGLALVERSMCEDSIGSRSGDDVLLNLIALRNDQLKDLQAKMCVRKSMYRKLYSVPNHERSDCHWHKSFMIKQDAEDLNKTLELGTEMVCGVLERLVNLYDAESVNRIWFKGDIVPGDYRDLAQRLLSDMFSQEFLLPLEATDESIVILTSMYEEKLEGILDRLSS